MKSIYTLIILLICMSNAAKAADAVFPIACQPGLNCFILAYPDVSSEPGKVQDYTCGKLAYDGDMSLRIGMSSIEALRNPVNVLATRAGVITDAQDGVPDLVISSKNQLRRGASLCGNGVVIDHGGGIVSAYCHLRNGSVKVKAGDRVNAGDVIGYVGQSGYATWPQLGFSFEKGGVFLDPISAVSAYEGCGFKPKPVIPLPPAFTNYSPVAIPLLGYSDRVENEADMMTGASKHLTLFEPEAGTMNFWAMIIGLRKGDETAITLYDVKGRPYDHQVIVADADAERMPINITRNRGIGPWRSGLYTADIAVTRTVKGQPYTVTRRARMLVP